MKKVTLYHNPRCSKSRAALMLLETHDIETHVHHYLENPLSAADIRELLKQLRMPPRQLLRTSEALYQELKLADHSLSEDYLISALAQHPQLMERPIISDHHCAIIGRPPEKVLEFIND